MANDEGGNGLVWFLAGLSIGAIAGILYAPKSGAETRETLRRSAEDGRDYVITNARKAREQAGEWIDRGRDVLGQHKETIVQAVNAGKQAYREATSDKG